MSIETSDHAFSLGLSHDVDRVSTGHNSLYKAFTTQRTSDLHSVSSDDPYWQFEDIMALESQLGVRSSFYFLNTKRPTGSRPIMDWIRPWNWQAEVEGYNTMDSAIVKVIRQLYDGGWEIGLQGSPGSTTDRARLAREKDRLETVLGRAVVGGRQHGMDLHQPDTWRHYEQIGLQYDASLGSTSEVGFQYGYDVFRPFDNEFLVFPVTAVESALMEGREFDEAWRICEDLLDEAAANQAVMTVRWHQQHFNEQKFPGYKRLYSKLVRAAQQRGAWVGPLGELYDQVTASTDAQASSENDQGRTPEPL